MICVVGDKLSLSNFPLTGHYASTRPSSRHAFCFASQTENLLGAELLKCLKGHGETLFMHHFSIKGDVPWRDSESKGAFGSTIPSLFFGQTCCII